MSRARCWVGAAWGVSWVVVSSLESSRLVLIGWLTECRTKCLTKCPTKCLIESVGLCEIFLSFGVCHESNV